jgi:hypothetical protein
MKCPVCDGKGGWQEDMGEGTTLHEKCPFCKKGRVNPFEWMEYWIWQYVPAEIIEWFDRRQND